MFNYTDLFEKIKQDCLSDNPKRIDSVMKILDSADLPTTRAVDYYLGLVENKPSVARISYYLFNGSQIQRNYATLYFARRNEWKKVNEAYELGLIDAAQAYSR